MIKTKKFSDIPSYAVCYLAYGDLDGLTDDDIKLIDKFCKNNNIDHLVSCSDDTHFCYYPDFGLGSDCVEAEFILRSY